MILRGLAFVALAYALGFVLFVVALPRGGAGGSTDAVVVLTGGAGRIERGLARLRAGSARRMLISGVDRRVRPHELAARIGGAGRLFDCCVDLGREAVDTRSNAEETARWLKQRAYHSLRLVTTDWHMPRARFELARAAPGVAIVPDPVASDPTLPVLLREYSKYVLRRAAALTGV